LCYQKTFGAIEAICGILLLPESHKWKSGVILAKARRMEAGSSPHERREDSRGKLGLAMAIVSLAVLLIFTIWVLVLLSQKNLLYEVACKHFLFIVGMPVCCMVSLIILGVFRATSGPLQFKALGMEFQGAAGQVVLWVFVFLGSVCGAAALWSLKN
jgi:hypothetical protein